MAEFGNVFHHVDVRDALIMVELPIREDHRTACVEPLRESYHKLGLGLLLECSWPLHLDFRHSVSA